MLTLGGAPAGFGAGRFLVSTIGIERVAAHSSYENQIAHQYAQMAGERGRGDPPRQHPGQFYVGCRAGPARGVRPKRRGLHEIPLHSGQAAGATSRTGQVDINAPDHGLGRQQRYPILSPNTEFPGQTPMPIGVGRRPAERHAIPRSGGTPSTAANPVVGRYAY
ncbi:MAG: hypothetical protein WDO13_08100 [Verrucomicrobiota bacterium]